MKTLLIIIVGLMTMHAQAAAEVAPLTTLVPLKNADGSIQKTVLASTFGQTLYSFDPDSGTPGSSACDGKCAEVWPPITVTAAEVTALNSPDLGTVKRKSGLLQLTFKGQPVYTFNMDRAVGDIKGDGIGGVWHIIPE